MRECIVSWLFTPWTGKRLKAGSKMPTLSASATLFILSLKGENA